MAANLSSEAVRFRWVLLVASVVLAVVGTGAVVVDRLDDGGTASDQVLEVPTASGGDADDDGSGAITGPGPAADPGPSTDDPERRPAPGQVRLRGTVTAVRLGGAVLAPRTVPTPLTLVSERGFGNGGDLTDVAVAGRASEIVWDGGRPFVLSSGPGLVLDPVEVTLVPEGLRLLLGGGVHALEPGEYRLNTPVAVGSGGLATPRDSVTFTASTASLFAASGDTALVLGPTGPHRFLGPGRVQLEGELEVVAADARTTATSFDLAEGVYDLVLTPGVGDTWTVSGTSAAP